jgi:BirA family biotin operon repressor/biotin-[acetyl-CoA-carboxylase] ligase
LELDRWLERLVPGPKDPLPGPLAVIARRQRFGRGQQGRHWQSPAGGVWLSAALPWPADPATAAAPGLAAAVGLALELEALGLEVRLKWPNDLLLAAAGRPAKLAGLLPRLRLRGGMIRWARIGLGLNGCNPVPAGATNLVPELGRWQARPDRLAPRVLQALEWAMAMADQPQAVRRLAERRLLVAPGSWDGAAQGWQPIGLTDDGALLLARGDERRRIERRFE